MKKKKELKRREIEKREEKKFCGSEFACAKGKKKSLESGETRGKEE